MPKKAFPAFVLAFFQNVAIADVGNVASAFRNAGNITGVFTSVSKTPTKIFFAGVVPTPFILSPAFCEMPENFLAFFRGFNKYYCR